MKLPKTGLGLLLICLLALAGCQQGQDAAGTPAPDSAGDTVSTAPSDNAGEEDDGYTREGEKALDFTVTLLNGEEFTLSEMEGQVVVLNFWATWCSPCVAELPELEQLAEEYADRGVYLLAINCGESQQKVQDFMDSRELNLNVALDETISALGQFPASGIPFTVYIDPEGVVAYIQPGAYKEDNYGHLAQALDEVLAEFEDAQ